MSAEDLQAVSRYAPGILRAAGFGGRRVAEVSRLAGGSKKGVYRLACGGGFSVVLYVWSAAEDYWPAEPDGDDAGVFGHASGIGLFEASGRALAAAGVRIPEVYLLDRALRQLARAAGRVPEIAAARPRLTGRLRALAASAAPRAEYALIHGELGPDHVLLDGQRMPVVVDIEGAMYFDAEWEHAFLRLRFGRHYQRLALPGLDERRISRRTNPISVRSSLERIAVRAVRSSAVSVPTRSASCSRSWRTVFSMRA